MLQQILFYLAVILGIIIFLKLGKNIPLINRFLISISVLIILILLFAFISAILALVVIFIIIFAIIALFNGNYLRFRKIKLKR